MPSLRLNFSLNAEENNVKIIQSQASVRIVYTNKTHGTLSISRLAAFHTMQCVNGLLYWLAVLPTAASWNARNVIKMGLSSALSSELGQTDSEVGLLFRTALMQILADLGLEGFEYRCAESRNPERPAG